MGETLPFFAEEIEPREFFDGSVLLAAPHQDDGVLACGAALSRLSGSVRVHVVYATDGAASPAPVFPWEKPKPTDLPRLRAKEARNAMGHLGVARDDIHFLSLPDGGLREQRVRLGQGLARLIDEIRPRHLLLPFRFDRHRDHIALNHAGLGLREGEDRPRITEYFVYTHAKLLPRGDMRAHVRPGQLKMFTPGEHASVKREALDCFRSQTTRMYPWQTRPNFGAEALDAIANAPEVFLRYDPKIPGSEILDGPKAWILAAHYLEPRLKKWKDQMKAILQRSLGTS
jgi:LmbE family N-acetylglucosaminyl deacetylase